MNYDLIFSIANTAVMPAWLLLWFFPQARVTQLIVYSYLYPTLLGLLYAVLLITAIITSSGSFDPAAFSTLEGIQALLGSKQGLLAGWVHYLCFDLFTGIWIARDAQAKGIGRWSVLPALFFTLMAGPMGLLLYLSIRWWHTRTWSLA